MRWNWDNFYVHLMQVGNPSFRWNSFNSNIHLMQNGNTYAIGIVWLFLQVINRDFVKEIDGYIFPLIT